jgi:hypothetical protein
MVTGKCEIEHAPDYGIVTVFKFILFFLVCIQWMQAVNHWQLRVLQ